MIEKIYSAFLKHPVITTDTRKIVPGSIFFALKGPNFNANTLAKEAVEKGCTYAVVDEKEYASDDRFFLVDDVLSTLQKLANHHRRHIKIPVLGLTGSNGKTTSKELIYAVLSQQYNTLATAGNLNNHIGVPLTILSIKPEHEFAIIEMGANHVGEIALLSDIAMPDYGLITNIGIAHIEGFGSAENIRKAKGELYDFIRNKKGILFVNGDNPVLSKMSAGIEHLYYGTQAGFYLQGKLTGADPFVKVEINNGGNFTVETEIVGKYNFENILAAACIGKYFGLTNAQIKTGLENYQPDNNRSQVVKKGSNTIVMDAYNANPSSMKAAIENFAEMKGENKLLILGDMFEMGDVAEEEHRKILDQVRSKNLQAVFLGKEFGKLNNNNFQFFSDAKSAENYFRNLHPENQLILIKGSRGMKLETILDWL